MRRAGESIRRCVLTCACAAVFGSVLAGADLPQLAPQALSTGIVINVPQRLLFLLSEGVVVARYPVGVGRREWPTFLGSFTILLKEVDPVWDVPQSIQEELRRNGKPVLTRVAPGPSNPLGKYWLGLSVAGFGIHGTNAPASISTFQTHGCIRLHAADIADLFERVDVGTSGVSVYEPVLVAVVDGGLWMEAHPDVYRRDRRDLLAHVAAEVDRLAPATPVDWSVVRLVLQERKGRPERMDLLPPP